MKLLILLPALVLFCGTLPSPAQPPDGGVLFTQNCVACHMKDQGLVGPSMVEIRSLYLGKPDDFVKWAVAPGKKRPGAIDMPSMVHVGEPGLRAIHSYIMKAAEGVKEKQVQAGDPFAASHTHAVRPRIQRIFLPDAGPAAIAVALDETTSLCWDAGEGRLRYAWTGGFIDGYPYWKGKGNSLAKIKGTIRHIQPHRFFSSAAPVFHGYDIVEGLPVFRYTVDGRGTGLLAFPQCEVAESFRALPGGAGFEQRFVLTPKPDDSFFLTLTFAEDPKAETTSNKGRWEKNKLTLTPDEAADFTLTHKFR